MFSSFSSRIIWITKIDLYTKYIIARVKTAKSEVYKIFSKIQISIKGGISNEYNQENQICSFGKNKIIKKIGKNL